MPFLARFSINNNNNNTQQHSKLPKQKRERRTGPPPPIKPRDSSLYSNNFAAAASVSCLPLYGSSPRNQSSFALALPRPHTDYDLLARRNLSCIEISRAPEHPPSGYQSFAYVEDDVFHPTFAIPSEDFALSPKATLSRRSAFKSKSWASRSVIGLVRRRMSGAKQDEKYMGDQWPVDSQYPQEQDDMAPPPVPSRSALRAPATIYTSPAVYQLPVDPPKDTTPSLSSASSDDGEMPTSPDLRTPASSDHSWGRKKRQESRDPLKVRDGAPRKESTSGVYTPNTFPGAHGPRPSHFPTHVYTPSQYPGPAPSRSSSMSSTSASGSDRSSPRTPISSVSPKWSTTTLTSGFRRLSTTFASLDPRQSSFNRESYFPPISTPSHPTHSRTTSWSGASALGFDVPPSPPANRTRHSTVEIKRKPVPKLDEVQVEIEKLDLERDESRTPTA